MATISAHYYDGQRARRYGVLLEMIDGDLHVTGEGVDRRARRETLEISDHLGTAPRLIRFPDGAFCEVASSEFDRLLANHPGASSVVSQWESMPTRWIAVSVIFVILLVLAYRYGLPALASVIAARVPPPMTERLSAETLKTLDWQVLEPSQVRPSRQTDIAGLFGRLRLPGSPAGEQYRLLFRKSAFLGANAMALPSGTIIVTDDLIRLSADDREMLGVFAHEAGHVRNRHQVRLIVQGSALAIMAAWFVGDVSSLLASAPTALLQAKYSRDLEREADDYAIETMRLNGIAPTFLATLLERLETDGKERGHQLPLYLSSHPATEERLRRLRDQSRAGGF